MPGLTGIEAARQLYDRCHIVFVTAYDQYAIDAFEHGAVDYLLKPVDAGAPAHHAASACAHGCSSEPQDIGAQLAQLSQLRRSSGARAEARTTCTGSRPGRPACA